MADVVITPASGLIDFSNTSGISSATIQLDGNGNLNISAAAGDIQIGDTSSDIYIGDGVNNVDIIFEQDGEIRGLTGKTVILGQTDSYIKINAGLKDSNGIVGAAGSVLSSDGSLVEWVSPQSGPQGTQGTQGTTGTATQGTQGTTGTATQGTQGTTGTATQGTQGTTGTATQGTQGTTGTSVQGAQGATGTATQGTQGTTGTSVQGAQGATGTATQGTQGTTGTATQGTQGIQGITGPVAGSANQIVYKNSSNAAAGSDSFTYSGPSSGTGTVGIGTIIDIVHYDTQNSGTLSFEASAGQLFSITNNLSSGSIFSVNDISGIPSIDVDADGTILVGPYSTTGDKVGIGTTNPGYKLHVAGNTNIDGTLYVNGSQIGARGASNWTPNLTNVTQSSTDSGTFTKTGGSNSTWDSQVYSSQGYVRGCYASARISSTSGIAVFGFNSDPTTNADYTSIDYGFGFYSGSIIIFESGVQVATPSNSYTTSDTAYVIYDGTNVRYYLNGTLLKTTARSIGSALYLDSSIYTSNLAFNQLAFGPMGEQGTQGTTGTSVQGTQGTTGTSVQGTQGTTGTSVQGAQGTTGTSVQGAQGTTGTSVQGAQGTTGTSVQGTQGTTGTATQGTQGITGTSVQGTQGTTGISDITLDTAPQLGGNLDVNSKLISFGDSTGTTNNRLIFGAGSDLQIYHNGSNSYVLDQGTGGLILGGSNISVRDSTGSTRHMQFGSASAGNIIIDGDGSYAASLHLKSENNGSKVIMKAPTNANFSTTTWTLTLPGSAGSNGQVLATDGNGNTSWLTRVGESWTVYQSATGTSNNNFELMLGTYTLGQAGQAYRNTGLHFNPSTNLLTTPGAITAAGNVTAYSDINLKKEIKPIKNALDKVLKINGVTFERSDLDTQARFAGVIAQEVEQVLPEVVMENENGTKSVAYGNMVALLIEAVKEQQNEINILKEKINNAIT
jgi:hypothetical protein